MPSASTLAKKSDIAFPNENGDAVTEAIQRLCQYWDDYLGEKFMKPSEVDEKIVITILKAYQKLQEITCRRQGVSNPELIGMFCTCLRQEIRWLRDDAVKIGNGDTSFKTTYHKELYAKRGLYRFITDLTQIDNWKGITRPHGFGIYSQNLPEGLWSLDQEKTNFLVAKAANSAFPDGIGMPKPSLSTQAIDPKNFTVTPPPRQETPVAPITPATELTFEEFKKSRGFMNDDEAYRTYLQAQINNLKAGLPALQTQITTAKHLTEKGERVAEKLCQLAEQLV